MTAQVRVGDWESITGSNTINDLIIYGDTIICATKGGLLLLKEDQSMEKLSIEDGLSISGMDILFKGPAGYIWLSSAGSIQVYDPVQHKSKGIFNFDLDEVVDFTVFKGVVYGAYRQGRKWGIIEFIYNNDQYYYRDLYEHPTLNNISGMEVLGDTLFLGSDIGLIGGNPHTTHISRWKLMFNDAAAPVKALDQKDGELFVITEESAFSFKTNSSPVNYLIDDARLKKIIDIKIRSTGDYIALSDSSIYELTETSFSTIFANPGYLFKSVESAFNNQIVIGSNFGLIFSDDIFNPRTMEGPLVEEPTALSIFPNGNLIMASGQGISFKSNDSWLNWSSSTALNSEIRNNLNINALPFELGSRVNALEILNDGSIFAALQGTSADTGSAVIIIKNISTDFVNISSADSSEFPYFIDENGETSFHVLDFAQDLNSNLWAVSLNSQDQPLSVFTGGKWNSFSISDADKKLSRSVTAVTVDNFNRIWIAAEENNLLNQDLAVDGGLTILDISGDPDLPSETDWLNIDPNPGFQNKTVLDIEVTRKNRLYVLTPIGLFYKDLQISAADPVAQDGPRNSNGYLYPYFPNVPFPPGSKIKIDPRGNVWAASPAAGLHVLLENGEYWPDVFGFTEVNSPLLSNQITGIDFDDKRGLVFISSSKGINILKIPFAQEIKSFNQVQIFPSPFRIPNHENLIIGNLKDKTNLKIMTITGKVVRSIGHNSKNADGYQISWNGRDDNGKWVTSGVYLLALYDKSGSSSIRKITVIKY